MRLKAGSGIDARSLLTPTAKRVKRRMTTFSPVVAVSSSRSCWTVLPSNLGLCISCSSSTIVCKPRVELAGDDFLAHVLGLVGRLLLVDPRLGVALLGGNVLAADVFDGRGCGDLHRDVAREADEVLVRGHEVGVAVDLDQHSHLGAGVNVGLDGALGGDALAEVLDLLALP